MANDIARKIFIEHPFMMIVALVTAHIGSMQIKRSDDSRAKYVRSAIWFTVTALVIVAAIPWDRPMFPALG